MLGRSGRLAVLIHSYHSQSCGLWITAVKEHTPTLSFGVSSIKEYVVTSKHLVLPQTGSRSYADAPVSRPKAHTGRSTSGGKKARKKTPAKEATTEYASKTKKPKKKSSKAKAATKSKKSKAKKKAKAKPKPRKVLTEEQKAKAAEKRAKAQLKELKAKALLTAPKRLPATSWAVFNAEQLVAAKGTGQKLQDVVSQSSSRFKALQPAQLEVRTSRVRILYDIN